MLINKYLESFGRYLVLMGRTFARPERMRMSLKQYVKEMSALGVNSIGIVLLISFFIGAVICIQIKLNIQSPWMPRFVTGYVTREIMLLEFSSSIMCLILAGKVGSNIASEIGTMRVTQQIDALDIMGVNSANFLILPKIMGMITLMPFLVIFSTAAGIVGAYATAVIGNVINVEDLTIGLQHDFNSWFMYMSIIKSIFFAFIITSVSSYYGYTVEGGSVEVGTGTISRWAQGQPLFSGHQKLPPRGSGPRLAPGVQVRDDSGWIRTERPVPASLLRSRKLALKALELIEQPF